MSHQSNTTNVAFITTKRNKTKQAIKFHRICKGIIATAISTQEQRSRSQMKATSLYKT